MIYVLLIGQLRLRQDMSRQLEVQAFKHLSLGCFEARKSFCPSRSIEHSRSILAPLT